MHVADALRQLLHNLASATDETEHGQAAQDNADEILAVLIHNREAAGRIMLALGSLIAYSWLEHDDNVDIHEAANTLAQPPDAGEPLPQFANLLIALADANQTGQPINTIAVLLSAQITLDITNTSIILWIMGTYLMVAAPTDPTERDRFIEAFVASSLRQEIIFDDELSPAPPLDL